MEFDTFWQAYPRKIGKLAAMKAYRKALTLAKPEEILAGVKLYIENKPDYADWCHPTTWLNAGRWMDEYESTRQEVDTDKYRRPTAAEAKMYLAEHPYMTEVEWVPKDWQPRLRVAGVEAG